MLGDVAGRDVLEVGSRRRAVLALGAGARRPRGRARPVATRQLQHSRRIDDEHRRRRAVGARAPPPHLPFADASLRRRLLRLRRPAVRRRHRRRAWPRPRGCCAPGGRLRLLDHPPDAVDVPRRPRPRTGLTARLSPTGTARRTSRSTTPPARSAYVEHHRTLGDWVALLARARASCSPTCSSREWPERPRPGLGRLVAAARAADARAPRSSPPTCGAERRNVSREAAPHTRSRNDVAASDHRSTPSCVARTCVINAVVVSSPGSGRPTRWPSWIDPSRRSTDSTRSSRSASQSSDRRSTISVPNWRSRRPRRPPRPAGSGPARGDRRGRRRRRTPPSAQQVVVGEPGATPRAQLELPGTPSCGDPVRIGEQEHGAGPVAVDRTEIERDPGAPRQIRGPLAQPVDRTPIGHVEAATPR